MVRPAAFIFFLGSVLLSPLASAQTDIEPEVYRFTYDAANNLTSRTVETGGMETTEFFPSDPSGRNRPASIGEVPLAWDGNGNLIQKGDLYFAFDYRNRLVEIRDAAGVRLGFNEYDALGRRVRQTIGGDVIETVWKDWQPVETYVNGVLASRRTYGVSIDEIVYLEQDLDLDGVLETKLHPIYDHSGNLAVVTGANGKPIERYSYDPYGRRRIYVDATRPEIDQALVAEGEIWIELSETISFPGIEGGTASGAVRLEASPSPTTYILTAEEPFLHRKRHRLVLIPDPLPAVGTELTLTFEPETLVDIFHNQPPMAEVITFSWPENAGVVFDRAPPKVVEVKVTETALEIEFSQLIDPEEAGPHISLSGMTTDWTVASLTDPYRLNSLAPVPAGSYSLVVSTALSNMAGRGMAEPFALPLTVESEGPPRIAYREPDPRQIAESAVGNAFGFHGLPRDPLTGFVYIRNRYYDPDLGRFITADPMGYVDGPSQYAGFGNNPVDFRDPLGLYLQVSKAEQEPLTKFYGAGNVTFDQAGVDRYNVSIRQAGLAHIDAYVRRTGGSARFATQLNQAIQSPFYQYNSLTSVSQGQGAWIGRQYEGSRLPGMPPGWAIDSPGSPMGYFGTSVGSVPISPWEQTTPGMIHEGLDFAFSPGNLLFVMTLMTPMPGDEEAVAGLTLGRAGRRVPGGTPRLHTGQQGKHIPGHNNYIPGRSPLTHSDPQGLLDRFAGTGQAANKVPRGTPGFRERVDFGEIIGEVNGQPTTKGIIHYGKDGAHIVPANP